MLEGNDLYEFEMDSDANTIGLSTKIVISRLLLSYDLRRKMMKRLRIMRVLYPLLKI